jgi:quercetin dioxygenase-like cupin family protein
LTLHDFDNYRHFICLTSQARKIGEEFVPHGLPFERDSSDCSYATTGRPVMNMVSNIPPDDLTRTLKVADPDGGAVKHVSVAGGTYTILVSGEDTGGKYCLIDMFVPPAGGPPPHRHDFEEMFCVLEGAIDFTFRGETTAVFAGTTINIPANAPHSFKNNSSKPARLLCMCTPAGQDEFFLQVGFPVDGRTAPPPDVSPSEKKERMAKAGLLLAKYRTEMLG